MVLLVKLHKKEADTIPALYEMVLPEDLLQYGFIPELIGRLPVISPLEELSDDALLSILTDPKNAMVKQYQKLFEMDGINFSITPSAIDYIVDKAMEYNLGARGLRNLCEAILNDAMFNLPNSGVKNLSLIHI